MIVVTENTEGYMTPAESRYYFLAMWISMLSSVCLGGFLALVAWQAGSVTHGIAIASYCVAAAGIYWLVSATFPQAAVVRWTDAEIDAYNERVEKWNEESAEDDAARRLWDTSHPLYMGDDRDD